MSDSSHTLSSSLALCTPQSCRPVKNFRSPGMSPIMGSDGSFISLPILKGRFLVC
jgi:hypothetical protein